MRDMRKEESYERYKKAGKRSEIQGRKDDIRDIRNEEWYERYKEGRVIWEI